MRTLSLVLASLVLFGACRRDADGAPPAAAVPRDHLFAADAVQFVFEADLDGWVPVDGGVRFTFRKEPRFRKDGASSTQLATGETLALVDKHLHHTLTLRRVSEDELGFDFTWRHRPPNGKVETASGQLVLTHGFSPRWRACAVAADCVVIPTYCGGADAVSVRGRELAAAFYARLSMTKDCVVKPPREPGSATCVEGACRALSLP